MSIEKLLEKKTKAVIHVRIDEKLHSLIVKKAKQMNVSLTRLTEALFREFINHKK